MFLFGVLDGTAKGVSGHFFVNIFFCLVFCFFPFGSLPFRGEEQVEDAELKWRKPSRGLKFLAKKPIHFNNKLTSNINSLFVINP